MKPIKPAKTLASFKASITSQVVIGLLSGSFAFTSASHAQQWGTGQWGGMQGCPYANGPAAGASSEDDELNEIALKEKELKQDQKDNKTDIRDKEKERKALLKDISAGLKDNWGDLFMSHMDSGQNCGICGADRGPRQDSGAQDDETQNGGEAADIPAPQSAPPVPRAPQKVNPKRRTKDPGAQRPTTANEDAVGDNSTPAVDRFPASEGRAPAASQAGTSNGADAWGDLGEGVSGGGGDGGGTGTLCYPNTVPFTRPAFQFACRPSGHINPAVCSTNPFRRDGATRAQSYACSHALDAYRKLVDELNELEMKKVQIKEDIDSLKVDRKEAEKAKREEALEANCATCHPGGQGGGGRSYGPSTTSSLISTLAPILTGVAAGGLSEYFSYKANQDNNKIRSNLGYASLPYQFGGAGLPYVGLGMQYGALGGAVNGSFGCSPGLGGSGSPYGPLGMGGPLGLSPYASQGGAFGYPPGMMPGFPVAGGGMYNQGFGPWGVAGPQGYGGAPQIGIGFGGAPGFGGGFGGPGGFGGGIGGGIGVPGLGGIGGGIGFGGGPGFGGGFGGGAPFGIPGFGQPSGFGGAPGFGGGFGGGPQIGIGVGGPSAFGYGSQTYNPLNPFGSNYSSPFGGGGGFGGAPGFGGGGYGGGSNPYAAQSNYYNNYIGRQMQGQELSQKYSSLQTELGQFNNGLGYLNGSNGFGNINSYNTMGGLGISNNFGLGVSYSPNYYGGSQLPYSTLQGNSR